jgi:hypothetical protein
MDHRRPLQDFDDRKSTVSSYYGRRSQDILSSNPSPAEHLPMTTQPRQRIDSSSSYNPKGNGDEYSPRHDSFSNPPSARGAPHAGFNVGYNNRDSFAQSRRSERVKGAYDDEEEGKGPGWDVYADFNNAGPRYSQNLLNMGNSEG